MSDADPTRRAFMLAAGLGSGLFGAFAVDDGPDAPSVSYDDDGLRQVARLGAMSIPAHSPVPLDASHLTSHRERAESLLASAPVEPEIPNEAVAQEYRERRARAVESLDAVGSASTRFERLHELRSARYWAADAAAVVAAIDGDLSWTAVRDRLESTRADWHAFETRWRYVGDDAVRALAVHAELESHVSHADRLLTQADEARGRGESRSLELGSRAGSVERAQALVTDAGYLYDRHLNGLGTRRALRDAFDRALEALRADVSARCPNRSHEELGARIDHEPPYSAARPLLGEAFSETRRRCAWVAEDRAREDEGVATALVAAGAADRDLRAADTVETAVSRGEYGVPTTLDEIRREKLDALAALETAQDARPAPLSRGWARTAVRSVERGDQQLVEMVDHDHRHVSDVADAVAEYAWGTAVAASTPQALSRLVGVVDAAASPDDR